MAADQRTTKSTISARKSHWNRGCVLPRREIQAAGPDTNTGGRRHDPTFPRYLHLLAEPCARAGADAIPMPPCSVFLPAASMPEEDLPHLLVDIGLLHPVLEYVPDRVKRVPGAGHELVLPEILVDGRACGLFLLSVSWKALGELLEGNECRPDERDFANRSLSLELAGTFAEVSLR